MKVEIIAVGNEVVYGHTVNTNASYLAKQVQVLGMEPNYISAICDNREVIERIVQEAIKRSEIVILTGGLGPTPDDLTKEAVCSALEMEMEIIPEALEKLKAYFEKQNRQMTENNIKQVAFPKQAIILPNDCGTAPGCLIEVEGVMVILLPGPPKEMKMMFENYVMPILRNKQNKNYITLDIKCYGIGESELATCIESLLGDHEQLSVATYVSNGEVIVRITAWEVSEMLANQKVQEMAQRVEACLEDYIIGYNEDTLEENVVKLLLERGLTISTVESCTGGLIAGTLVNCGGVSSCFKEGIVTYSNEAKMHYVGVQKTTLDKVGAVSEETAKEMAEGIRKIAKVDIGLSSTGIAGPGGGTPSKPVGLVYIGIAMEEGTQVFKLQLNGTRQEVREKTVKTILYQLYKKLK